MSDAEGFGPVGPEPSGAAPFAIAGPAQVTLGARRAGAASFTVSNITGRPVRARVSVEPGAGADAGWFRIEGDAERSMPVAGTATVDVTITVAERAPAGAASFVLGAALEEAPDQVVSSPTVAFDAPAPARRRFPWWILILIVVGILVLAGAGALIWPLTRPDAAPTQTATPTPEPTYTSGQFIATPETYFDLDTNQAFTTSGQGEDVYFYQGGGSGELGVVGQGPPRIAVVGQPTREACEGANDYDDVDKQNVPLLPELQTYVCVEFTHQGRRAVMTIGPATDAGFPVSFVTWDRG